MKSPIRSVQIFSLAALMALGGVCSTSAQTILHGIPGGDLTGPTGLTTNPINGTKFPGEGEWKTHTPNVANATATIVGSGASKHIELWRQWNQQVSVWYVDEGITPLTDTIWEISATLSLTGSTAGLDTYFRLYSDAAVTSLVFQYTINGTQINWTAGSQSGTFVSSTGLDATLRTLSFTYNPVSGLASGTLGTETIFDSVEAGPGLFVKSVWLASYKASASGASTLSIYDLSAVAVPEPATLVLLALGFGVVVVFRRRHSEAKS